MITITEVTFRTGLLAWYSQHHRPLPWKEERDAYVIWLSEIILQQTRVEQGLPYFLRFLERFPDVDALASAPEDEVMKLWEGLGYYSRARNLMETARFISRELEGVFPDTYEGIRALKGVGPYTAAAIASFAYDLPHAVVDGNVFRVLTRVFGIEEPIDTGRGKALVTEKAQRLIDPRQPGRYNQAIMDFGATHCTPRNPGCGGCPFAGSCVAHRENRIENLPRKSKRSARRDRFFHYLVLQHGPGVFLRKRLAKDIWQGLFEFPLIELDRPALSPDELRQHPDWRRWAGQPGAEITEISRPFRQTLSHQIVTATFWVVDLGQAPAAASDDWIWVDRKNLANFAFPRIIDWYLRDNSLYLNLL